MASPRCRSIPESEGWDSDRYQDVLTGIVENHASGTLCGSFGPFAKNVHLVSGPGLMRSFPIAEAIIDAGQTGAVVHGARLQTAIHNIIIAHPKLKNTNDTADALAHDFADHVVAILKVIRTMRAEEQNFEDTSWSKRYPRTGRIRRQLGPADREVLTRILEKVSCDGLAKHASVETPRPEPQEHETQEHEEHASGETPRPRAARPPGSSTSSSLESFSPAKVQSGETPNHKSTQTTIFTEVVTEHMYVHSKAAVGHELADWSTWAKESDEPVEKRARSSRASSRTSRRRGVAPADEETMKFLQTAYDKCSAEIRKGKRLGHQLREVTMVKTPFPFFAENNQKISFFIG